MRVELALDTTKSDDEPTKQFEEKLEQNEDLAEFKS